MTEQGREDHFLAKVVKTKDCWVYVGRAYQGYGVYEDPADGRRGYAHRWSYERFVAPIPDGLVIDHLCNVKRCVRPDHLEVVEIAENTRRSPRGSRSFRWLEVSA